MQDIRIWIYRIPGEENTRVPHMRMCCYLSSCGHSWSRRVCGYPCPWWRTSPLCGCSWGPENLRTDAWVEWCSSSLDHLGKICIQWSACPVSSLPAGCEGQSCPERPKSGSSWDPAKTRLWEGKHREVRAGMMYQTSSSCDAHHWRSSAFFLMRSGRYKDDLCEWFRIWQIRVGCFIFIILVNGAYSLTTSHLENLRSHFHTSPMSGRNSQSHLFFAEWLFVRGLNSKRMI